MTPEKKLSCLKKILLNYGSGLVAFSGGTDSTFLLKVASLVLPRDKILAVTASSATYPAQELLFSKKTAGKMGVRHQVIRTRELEDEKFSANPPDRCYFCKRELFSRLSSLARKNKLEFILDGTNASDKWDFRPGNRAKEAFRIESPLAKAGLTKAEIRTLSRKLGLATHDKPALACLASRIPYGTRITPRLLKRINLAEEYLRGLGFRQVRLRHNGCLCRIEVLKKDIPALLARRDLIVAKLKKLGYNYVTVDLDGYRTGSLNPVRSRHL